MDAETDPHAAWTRAWAAPDAPTLPLLLARDIRPVLDARHLVRGLLLAGSAALLFGPSGCGKTHLATDLALHVAAGLPWHDRATEASGVVYVALEGGAGFRNRVAAWLHDHPTIDPGALPFAAVTAPVRLIEPEGGDALIAAILAAGPALEADVRLVVIDTVSRALAGGDENDPVAMGALVATIDRIRDETGAAVLMIHHSGKDTTRGARGHSLLRAAVDTEIEVSATGEDRAATVTKQRDLASGDRIGFRLRVVELGHDLAREPVTSCVVDPAEAGVGRPCMSPATAGALRVLHDLIVTEGQPLPSGAAFPAGLRGVPERRWWGECDTRRVPSTADDPASRRRAFNRAFKALLAAGAAATREGVVWVTHPEREAPP